VKFRSGHQGGSYEKAVEVEGRKDNQKTERGRHRKFGRRERAITLLQPPLSAKEAG